MEMGLAAILAAASGAVLVLVMAGHLLLSTIVNDVRTRGATSHALEVSINGRVVTINLSELDTEDPAKLDQTIEAVRAARKLEHA
jgi:hypothetical protein